MRPNRLQNALAALAKVMREVNATIDEMRSERLYAEIWDSPDRHCRYQWRAVQFSMLLEALI
jgi:hypothetical protein